MTAHTVRIMAGILGALSLAACSGGGGSTSGSTGGGSSVTPSVRTDVTTYKNDLGRTGQNLTESVLTTTNVNSTQFGLLRTLTVDGLVDAQPLYLAQLMIGGALHDTLFVATEHDSVFAFDVNTGATLWQVSLLGSGETTSDNRGCNQVSPEIGATATPVIDRSAGTIYLTAMSKDAAGNYHQRVHALNITTGAEMAGSPVDVQATYPTTDGTTTFDPSQYKERPALLLLNGVVYTSWSSHCDHSPYTGWLIGYNEQTLAQTTVLNIAPNSNGIGPSIWMAGGGLSVDANGSIYVLAANGAFDTTLTSTGFPAGGDYGSSFVRLTVNNGALQVADYIALYNAAALQNADLDLGSSDAMLLPDLTDSSGTVRHLVVGAGKDGNLYVVNRDQMGQYSATSNNIWQELDSVLPGGVFATPAYFNGSVYYGDVNGTLKAFSISNAMLSTTPVSQTSGTFGYPGVAPAISANGTANGIVWVVENTSPAVLHAYQAGNLADELYNSNEAANGRDHFGVGNKYITPTIADGKVFAATTTGVGVFGLL